MLCRFSGAPPGVPFSESSAATVEIPNAMIIRPTRNSLDGVRIFSFLSFQLDNFHFVCTAAAENTILDKLNISLLPHFYGTDPKNPLHSGLQRLM
jgi:hypothetical protein